MSTVEGNGDLKRIDVYYRDGKLVNKNCFTTDFDPDTTWSFHKSHCMMGDFDEHLIFTPNGEDSGLVLGRMGSLPDVPEEYIDDEHSYDYRVIGLIPDKTLEEIDEDFEKISEY